MESKGMKIKLTLNPDGDPTTLHFSANEVIIGNTGSGQAHLKIQDPSIHDVHIRIIDQGNRFLAINAANDPFTSLNGVPFGKKNILDQDRIQIGSHTILFETEHPSDLKQEPQPSPEQSHASCDSSSAKEKDETEKQASVCPERNVPQERDEELNSAEIEALLREVDLLEAGKEASENPSAPLPQNMANPALIGAAHMDNPSVHIELGDSPPKHATAFPQGSPAENSKPERPRRESLKVDLNPPQEEANTAPQDYLPGSWKKLGAILLATALLSVLICSGIYFKASGKNSQEEKKIAAGTADIAMAMVHAQLNHIVPSKQNWADPDFIQHNLACVLSPNLHSQAQIDDEGQFIRYPYILRVYTSGDMNRFLVIAQPAPNLLQWLVHKKAIVIDSTAMEMRKISDLKKLNRLLASPNPLDGKNGTEISKVVKEGTLMSLASLSGNNNNWGFPPPKALAFIRPGGENYIYNAPRYYPFGESFLRKALSLTGYEASSQEVASLRDEMEELSKFPEIVLYTSQGLQASIDAQKALSTFLPTRKFLVGYVKFNEKGYVASSNIFINDDANDIALLDTGNISSVPILENTAAPHSFSKESAYSFADYSETHSGSTLYNPYSGEPFVDMNHPLFLRLTAIASSRSRALAPISDKICSAYQHQNIEIIPGFNQEIATLAKEYLETDLELRSRMVQELASLYQEYSEMPLEQFMKFIEASKLTTFVHEALNAQNHVDSGTSSEEEIKGEMDSIRLAENIDELDNAVQKTAALLNLEKLPDPERLISLQETLYNTTTDKLSDFLLSPTSVYAKAPLKDHDRTTLIRILKTSWVTDPDEFDFFVGEFDYLKNANK